VAALEPVLWAFVQAFLVAIAAMLWTLWRADGQIAEQVAIGIGARMGNGLLLCVLGWLLLDGNGAPVARAALFTAFLSAMRTPEWTFLPSTWAAEILFPLLGLRDGNPLFYYALLATTAAVASASSTHLRSSVAASGSRPVEL
jgi:hypothetical protein